MVTGQLNKLSPKSKQRVAGMMTISNGKALWWDDVTKTNAHCLHRIEKPEILSISTHLIHIRGFEEIGTTPDGMKKLKYQEWFITK